MFRGMLDALKEESVGFLFNVQVEAAPTAPAVATQAAPEGLAEFAAAAARKQDAPAPAPAAVRAKGIEDKAPPLTYTGPSEDGSAEVKRRDGDGGTFVGDGTTRKERREAARRAAKTRRG
jgi:preprotein translocase subunit SecA